MSNIPSIISGHNKNLLNPTITQYGCNCRIREDCPLQNQWLTPDIICRADAHCEENNDHKFYFGVTKTLVKKRFRNHNRDFNQEQYRIYSKERLCSKERPLFDVKYLMSASFE